MPVDYAFSDPFTVVSNNNPNCAYWGCGSYSVAGDTITGNELRGTLQFSGTYSQIALTTINNENWHGFTVGAARTTVPEPSTYALMTFGIAGIVGVARRRA